MESGRESLSKKSTVPAAAAHITGQGYTGISLSPPVQKNPNTTSLPDQLKEGVESLSGQSMDDVSVHYNSAKPEKLNARAYAQGTDIHLGAGQEKHLPHETWHVVQQKQGRVQPTSKINGQPVNESLQLENEADVMGSKAIQLQPKNREDLFLSDSIISSPTVQRNGDLVQEGLQDQAGPELPGRDAERAAAKEAADSLMIKSSHAISLIENLVGLIMGIPVYSSRSDRAVGDAASSAAELKSELEITAGTGIESALLISNTSDAEMDAVFSANLNAVISAEASLSETLSLLSEHANPVAHIAVQAGVPGLAAEIMAVADEAKTEANTNRTALLIDANAGARNRKRDAASTAVDFADGINNIGGVAAGVAGFVEAAGVAGAGGGAVVGTLGGVLGILFGSIGFILGLYGFVTGKLQKKQLRKIAPAISDDEMQTALIFAAGQTDKAISRSKLVMFAGAAAVVAGTLGLIALTVASVGASAAVIGIAAAMLGLGIVAFKYFHKKSKRKAERRAFANSLVQEIINDGPQKFEAIRIITELGLNPQDALKTQADIDKLVDNLTGRVGEAVKNKRQKVAEGILDGLVNGSPSKQFEAELIINALGRNSDKARKRVLDGEGATEISRIVATLSSW